MTFIKKNAVILLVILSGFALRIWGINFGLPYPLHQDEPIVINHALAYGSGDLNPHFFIIPPISSYLLFFLYGIYFVIGRLAGIFSGVDDLALHFFRDPSTFYIIARVALGLVPGTLCVLMTYLLHRSLFSKEGALYSAAVMAFAFLPVINSHYSYVDNLMLFLVLSAYLGCLRITRDPSLPNYLAVGALIALAVNVKYNSALLVIPFLIAHVFTVYDRRLRKTDILISGRLWAAFIAAIAVFIATNPFSVLDYRFFAESVLLRIRSEHIGWLHHMKYSLYEGIGPGIFFFAAFGAAAILVREKFFKKIFFFSFPVLFYIHLALKSQQFSRYALPLVPFAAMAASYLIYNVILSPARTRFQKGLVMAFSVLLIVPTLAKSVKADILFAGRDTRVISAEWIEKNVSRETRIAVDHTSYRPAISQTAEQIKEKVRIAGAEKDLEELKGKKIAYMLKAAEGKTAYNIYFLEEGDDEIQFLSASPVIGESLEALRENGIEYVVINYNTRDAKDNFLDEIGQSGDVAAFFSPYADGRIGPPYDRTDNTFMAIGARELFMREHSGPCLVVYKLRKP